MEPANITITMRMDGFAQINKAIITLNGQSIATGARHGRQGMSKSDSNSKVSQRVFEKFNELLEEGK